MGWGRPGDVTFTLNICVPESLPTFPMFNSGYLFARAQRIQQLVPVVLVLFSKIFLHVYILKDTLGKISEPCA